MEFALKSLFRLIHITSGCILVGTTFADAFFDTPRPKNYALVQSITGVLLLVSGLVNMVLLAPSKNMGTLSSV